MEENAAMDRLERVRQEVDAILRRQPDQETSRAGFVHLYGVSAVSVLLAAKRGLDPQLCATAGMLHDIATYRTGNPTDHAQRGSLEAERIMRGLGCFSPEEIGLVCTAIARHSAKDEYDGDLAELLKDADVLQHYLYNPVAAIERAGPSQGTRAKLAPQIQRWRRTLAELGIEPGRLAGG